MLSLTCSRDAEADSAKAQLQTQFAAMWIWSYPFLSGTGRRY
jgi:hypothetical protein